MKHQGYSPDLIISHPGWGESLFLHDVWHDAKIAMYCEFYYCAEGADVGFDPEFVPREDEDVCRLRLKNINNHLHFEQVIAGISPTHWQASTFPDFFRPRISVIHEGINTKILTPNADATITFANGVTIRKNDEIITFVSRNLEPYRGFHIFMRSLPELLKRRPNARILIIGNNDVSYGTRPANGGSWKDVMVQEISPLINPADWQRVNFLGNIAYDHFVAILQITRVHVYLTYPFVLSWSLLEAMSIGAAIIASDTVPLHEAIIDKQTGRLVDFFDIPAWVDQICALLDDEEQRRFLGANARQFAQAPYDLYSVCLPKQMAWIESLL